MTGQCDKTCRFILLQNKNKLVLWATQPTDDSDEMCTVLEATTMQGFFAPVSDSFSVPK